MVLKSLRMLEVGLLMKNSIQIELKKYLLKDIGLKAFEDLIYPKEKTP